MRKFLLFAVALSAIIWTVSVQSTPTVQGCNAVCVPGPQCADCQYPCAKSGQCELMKASTQTTSATPNPATVVAAKPAKATAIPAKAEPTKTAIMSKSCGSDCAITGCRMAGASQK